MVKWSEAEYIIQGLVEQGKIIYSTDEDGKVILIAGPNFNKKMPRPKTIAGKKIKYV